LSKEKGVLSGCSVYLSGPIEYTTDMGAGWRSFLSDILEGAFGITILDPLKNHFVNLPFNDAEIVAEINKAREQNDYELIHQEAKKIIQRDIRLVDLADFVIALIDPSIPTFGTTHEVVVAAQQRKPILVYTPDKKKFPIWMSGLLKPSTVFDDWGDLLNHLTDITSGKIEIDSKYWKIRKTILKTN
jgi:nucleoside 2-deoxyribosyltransferase